VAQRKRRVMALQSHLFSGDRTLNACSVRDSAHIREGARGEAVEKIQAALTYLDNASIAAEELAKKHYGRTTAAAVLTYKQKRKIVNYAYETQADNMVGRMTINALDQDLISKQEKPVPRRQTVCRRPVETASDNISTVGSRS
jgi:hypothetical protein